MKFFEGSTFGFLMHSRFRICVLKGSATHFCPCYSCPKSGEGGKTRFASKIKVVLNKKLRLPKNLSCQIQLREVSKLHLRFSLRRIWHENFFGSRNFFLNTAPKIFSSFSNKGQLRPAVTRPSRLLTPHCRVF